VSDARESERREANRLGLDYRKPPPRKVSLAIVDIHSHIHFGPHAERFFEAADLYGIDHVVSMTPLADVPKLREKYPTRMSFIAIPDWKRYDNNEKHRDSWIQDLAVFREHGSKICKFWMAPPMRGEHGLTVDHPFLRPVVDAAVQLGYQFMIHAGDPSVWWKPGARYADTAKFGTKREQYMQVEWLLDHVAPRIVIGAHMGGSVEETDFLQGLLDRHANYRIDTSATKWIVREVARQPERVRDFVIRNSERVLFGSDLVAADRFQTFDHYASRYWAQQMMWETAYRGESPIEDPDADSPPKLAGVDLPADVLRKIYGENAQAAGLL
jgi:predicted TIM-barrel fold metal-dependent hydrolase